MNPDHMLPKHAYYRYTTLRNLGGQEGLVLPLHYSPMKSWAGKKQAYCRYTTVWQHYKYSLKPSGNQCFLFLCYYFVERKIYPQFKLSSGKKNGIIKNMPSNTTSSVFFCVYVLESLKNGKRYIGFTDNLKRRLEEHKRGLS